MVEMTRRQEEVLALLRRGLRNKEIARELGISWRTVKVHVSRVLLLRGCRDRLELLAREVAK
jgi:DNA-binding NarL/FixJ family response regulator